MSDPPTEYSLPPPSMPPPIMQPFFPPPYVFNYPPPPFVPPSFNQPPPLTYPPPINTHPYQPTSYTATAGIGQAKAIYNISTKADTSASHQSNSSAATRYKDDIRYHTAKQCSKPQVRYSSERDHDRSYDERQRRERDYRDSRSRKYRSSKSPSHSRGYRNISPRKGYYRGRYYEDRRKYERRHHDYGRRHGPSGHGDRSHESNKDRSYRSPVPSRHRHLSSGGEIGQSSRREMSPGKHETSPKPMSNREHILKEYRRNYCQTSDDFIKKMKEWSKDHKSDEEEVSKLWYQSSPAELYYKPVEGGVALEQTPELEKLCESFFKTVIERGRKARPQVDELPPMKHTKPKMCNKVDEDSSSSSESDDGSKGYMAKMMLELRSKESHSRRLHDELWFNNSGVMNGAPFCQCSAREGTLGVRHGVYAGELEFPKCLPRQNNLDKLFHYRITVSPPTNFLIKTPTIIGHEEHEFLFSGFSMFSHYKLPKRPICKVIRFNIEYTILYDEEPAPHNFSVQELDLFEEYLFHELLELVDLDLGKGTDTTCSQFHFMPRFARYLPGGGCEILSMCEVLKYLIDESGLLIPPENVENVLSMDRYTWEKFIDRVKGMIVTYPGKKPSSIRVDQLDRSPPRSAGSKGNPADMKTFYPEIIHFGIKPAHVSYGRNPKYQKAWREYVKCRHLIANMSKPTLLEKKNLSEKKAKVQEIRSQSYTKRDVSVAISSEGFRTTGLMCDVVQHAMLIPVLVLHLRLHKALDSLEENIGYVFKDRALLQTALTHPSYKENFGTNPYHARNTLTNCGIRQPEYGNPKIHHTKKKGMDNLINIMSQFGKTSETESDVKHNERLEFLGDAVVEFLSSIHLFRMFPAMSEGVLSTYRTSIVQNQHLALLAKKIALEKYMLCAHGPDLCGDEVVIRHAMANCFEALMGALFLDGGLKEADRAFALALWYDERDLLETWFAERAHPLQEQEPLGDRKYIKNIEFLQRLTMLEKSIGVQFKHIRVLARAFTDRSVGYTNLTLGSNERLEFLGDTVLQLVVTDRLYRRFPDHREGHLSLLRSCLVSNRTQSMVCDDLNLPAYTMYGDPKSMPTSIKHKADLLEAFLGALYIDKNVQYCQAFSNACLFPRLHEVILNQEWNDPKSRLQQCCLALRSVKGRDQEKPFYKVIKTVGPTNGRVFSVAVYFRGSILAVAEGPTIREAQMNAANKALASAHTWFPQLDLAKSRRNTSKRVDFNPLNFLRDAHPLKRSSLLEKKPEAHESSESESDSDSDSDDQQDVGEESASDSADGMSD